MSIFFKKYLGILVIGFVFILPNFVNAEGYKLYLYYDNQKNILSLDKSVNPNVEFNSKINDEDTYSGMISRGVEGDKDWENESNKYEFYIDFVGNDGTYKHNFGFNPKPGSFEIIVPYLNWVQELSIKSVPNNTNVLSVDVKKYSTCNQNLICEAELKEDSMCTPDCMNNTGELIIYSKDTEKQLTEGNGVIKDESGIVTLTRFSDGDIKNNLSNVTEETKPPIWPLILGIVLLVGGFGAFIYWRIKKRKQIKETDEENNKM